INQACVPHVSSMSMKDLQALADQACYFKVIEVDSAVAGFLLALGPGQPYESVNYRWFSEHFERFIYVDRIAFSADHRGKGGGRRLYEHIEREFRDSMSWLTREVNLK